MGKLIILKVTPNRLSATNRQAAKSCPSCYSRGSSICLTSLRLDKTGDQDLPIKVCGAQIVVLVWYVAPAATLGHHTHPAPEG